MTIPEAARLVVQAAVIGASGQVLVLDMGEPVRIVDLAKNLIMLSGHAVDDIDVVFTGLRSGEKLYEELLADADTTFPTPVERLRIARLGVTPGIVRDMLLWAEQQTVDDGGTLSKHWLRKGVPEYAVDGWSEPGTQRETSIHCRSATHPAATASA